MCNGAWYLDEGTCDTSSKRTFFSVGLFKNLLMLSGVSLRRFDRVSHNRCFGLDRGFLRSFLSGMKTSNRSLGTLPYHY